MIAIIDPADIHYYQPGWTMVGGGIFDAQTTAKTMGSLIPKGVHWIKAAVAAFEPKDNAIVLDGCRVVKYDRLVVCPGLKLDWDAVEGLEETLGRNGVTSNYRYDLAPLHVGVGAGYDLGPRGFHPAADADQMRGRAAKGDVSVGRSLVPARAC